MTWLISYMMITMVISLLILSIPLFFMKLMKKWLEKYSTFECGISLDSSSRKPFSLRFFLLMVLFIIFDIEIALILILPMINSWSVKMIIFMNTFLIILLMGLNYEWKEGSLNWKL